MDELVSSLATGHIMVYPTETVAGIGCIGSDKKAVSNIFAIKERDEKKPLSYAFSSIEHMKQYVEVPTKAEPLLGLFPGPLTLILPKKDNIPELYGVADDSVGVRIPDIEWILRLIEKLGSPIVSTSANIANQLPVSTISAMDDKILEKIDLLIHWEGQLLGNPSTVVSVLDGIQIIREGAIKSEYIYSLFNN